MNIVLSQFAPIPNGPYSQAIHIGPFLFCSGQTPRDPKTMEFSSFSLRGQTIQVLHNIKAVVEAAGFSKTDIIKTSVFLQDMHDFEKMNAVYAKFFGDHRPARTTIGVADLPKGALIMIDCIAFKTL